MFVAVVIDFKCTLSTLMPHDAARRAHGTAPRYQSHEATLPWSGATADTGGMDQRKPEKILENPRPKLRLIVYS